MYNCKFQISGVTRKKRTTKTDDKINDEFIDDDNDVKEERERENINQMNSRSIWWWRTPVFSFNVICTSTVAVIYSYLFVHETTVRVCDACGWKKKTSKSNQINCNHHWDLDLNQCLVLFIFDDRQIHSILAKKFHRFPIDGHNCLIGINFFPLVTQQDNVRKFKLTNKVL